MTKKVIAEIKERFKNIGGHGQRTYVANILVDSFLGEIFSNICEQAQDLEVYNNLLSIGIQVKKISPVSSDIWIDGIDFDNSRVRNNFMLLNTIMDKVIAVVRFVYSIPDDSILEICLLESEKVSSGEPYLFFKITGDGMEMVLGSFPMMKTDTSFLTNLLASSAIKNMKSMLDELCGNIPSRTINNEASNAKEKTIMKEDFKNNTKYRTGREDNDSNKDCNSHIEININVAVGIFNRKLITEIIHSKTKDENFYFSVDLRDNLDIVECVILKIDNKQCLLFECTNDHAHLLAGKYSTLRKMLTNAIMEKTATKDAGQLLLDNVLFTMLEAKLVEEFKREKEKHEKKKVEEISFDNIEYELVYNIDLLNQELSTIKNKLSENEETLDTESLDKELHEKAMYAMGVPERFFNTQAEELQTDNNEALKPNEFIDSEFMDIHELLDNGYSVNMALSAAIFNKFEDKVDSIDNRLAMKKYLKSITPPMLLAEIGAKKYSDGNAYNVLSKLKVDSDTTANSENNDEFEIVLKFKKPIGLGYHSSTETTESPDVFDVRADFISKYPELKENVSIARKVDKQGDISDIMEQKLRYDAVAATVTFMLHKDNAFLSSLMNLEIDDESKTEIGYAITRCRNSIVKESKK